MELKQRNGAEWRLVLYLHVQTNTEFTQLKRNDVAIGKFPLGKNGKFTKGIFCFLSKDQQAKSDVVVIGRKAVKG